MTREFIKEQIKKLEKINQCRMETFYLRYVDQNLTSNNWGDINKLESILDKVEKSRDCVQDILPIKLLVLINEKCVHVWAENPLWDPIHHENEDSHIYINVPMIGRNGWFIDPINWLDIDGRQNELKRFNG